jgi:hypothetical protein
MNSLPPNSKWEKTYWSAFSRDAHQLLAWGYSGALSLIGPRQEEPEITGFIVGCIRSKLNMTTCKRYERYSLHEESPFAGEERSGKERRRLDIFVESHTIQPRPRYVFEAKRLRKGSHGIGGYVGDEGIGRFVTNKYAAEWPVAAMIGYVQSEDANSWQPKLEAAFNSDLEDRLAIEKKLSRVCIIASIPDEWSSEHRRRDNDTITIFHILLNCTGNV